ncbi:YhcH/YjgK/YiaL family protein [Pricia antarctica]|uniref:YhcH/YjgK/YiaL family protein n=1 Tax=Pricia antarctica TaxID=641691 RepID=A0A1G7G7V4_9FLAO|nr:YhcH/YjgK/YiaL family protein [Pricia antarctica]SDE84119.1 YhcH/YjgK/YiaL family protein [Pricia antarctica]
MKKQLILKFALIQIILLVFGYSSFSQNMETPCNEASIANWYETGAWLNGLQLVPHMSIDQGELASQYCRNPDWWNKAFEFLRSHDLDNMEPGKYVIDEGNVTAFVSETPTKEKEEIKWETHKNFNDLQYVIKGKAKMGVASATDSKFTSTMAYDSEKDVENYSVENGKYFVSTPGTFFIFTPQDIHRPAIHVEGYDTIKKILIKVRVP